MKPILRVFKYLKFYPKEIVGNVLFNLLAVVFNLFSFVMIIPFVELLFGLTNPPAVEPVFAFNQQTMTDWMMWTLSQYSASLGAWKMLFIVAGGYLLCNLLSNAFRYLGLFFLSPIRNGIVCRIRNDVYHRMTILPVAYFNSQRKGDILSRLSNDLADVEWSVVSTLQSLVKDPINIILFAATLVFVSPRLFVFFLLVLPVAVFLISKVGKSLKRNSARGQGRLGDLFSVLEETLAGIRVVKLYDIEEQRKRKFEQSNREYARSMGRVVRRREVGSPLSEVIGTIGLVAILVLGGMLVFKGQMQASLFIFFVIIFARLIPPVQAVVKAYTSLQKGAASAARLFEVLDADEQITEKPNAPVLTEFTRAVEYCNVSFSYQPDDVKADRVPVLQHIDLTIPKGKTIALVGPSGAGKTTFVDLLPRFYDPVEGEIRIDGVPIADVNINSLRSMMAVVSQDCLLFNDTVAANIAMGRDDVSLDDIRHAAHLALADEFVEQLPQGYNTTLGDRGISLSGGQRQRISIARAILKNPAILILDEATSALDTESAQQVQQAISALMADRTSIVIAHHISTIRNADEIVVFDHGVIVEKGDHFSLISRNGLYKKLLERQEFE